MALRLRFFEQDDAEGILRLYRAAGDWFEEVDVSMDFIIASSERPDFRFIVAEDGGRLVGFIGALYYDAVGRAEIGPVGVDEEARGEGVGGMLVDGIIRFLRDRGVRRAHVKVKSGNDRAQSFFLSKGFSYEARLRGYTIRGDDVVQMVAYI